MSAERDLILALMRRLYGDGALDDAAIAGIADEIDNPDSDEHAQLAHETRLTMIPEPRNGREEMLVQHRRRQMRLRTEWLENKRKGSDETDSD